MIDSRNWSEILWREWHHTQDDAYAKQLHFALSKDNIGQPDPSDIVQGRPLLSEVEAALRQGRCHSASLRKIWGGRLERLDRAKNDYLSVGQSLRDLSHVHWFRRFLGRHLLFEIGGHAVEALEDVAFGDSSYGQEDARWVLHCISVDTTTRLAAEPECWICPDCWLGCGLLWIDRPWRSDWQFYGCRNCRRSRGLLHRTQEMVVVFDNRSSGLSCQEGLIRANWFTRRTLFDFDRIEIIRATDEDIERFAVQAGNDTDSLRRSRYPRMRCTIGPDCHLSANTIRILENSFGRVEQTTR